MTDEQKAIDEVGELLRRITNSDDRVSAMMMCRCLKTSLSEANSTGQGILAMSIKASILYALNRGEKEKWMAEICANE